jgi:myo-inositol-1(or 4)-monophosphatase
MIMAGGAGDMGADLELALDAAWAAGAAVMAWFRTGAEVRHKGPDQPVTAADLEADAVLAEHLRGGRPDYGWLSEETLDGADRLGRDRVWVVDPLDGTRSFIQGYREFAVSVALVESGEAVLGVVYNPASRDLYWAERGRGAYHTAGWTVGASAGSAGSQGGPPAGVRLRVREPDSRRARSLLASRSEIARGDFGALLPRWELRPLGSTAYKLAAVASGAGQAYLSRGPKSEWDVAAGALLVTEAGGAATDLRGEALRYNRADPSVLGVLAAPTGLHGELLKTTADLPSPRLDGAGDEVPEED